MKHPICEHCETAECLTPTGGTVEIADGELVYVNLEYECDRHGLTGGFENWGDVVNDHGAVLVTDEREVSLCE